MADDELMRSTKLRRHAAAKNASLLLVQDALVQIRAMAYQRIEVVVREDELPLEYHERIRLMAYVCENLPGYLRANTPGQGLRYAWHNANEMQQAWLRETLGPHGIAIA